MKKMETKTKLISLPEVVEIVSDDQFTDIAHYTSDFSSYSPGMTRLRYVGPQFTMTMNVSWDGERLV